MNVIGECGRNYTRCLSLCVVNQSRVEDECDRGVWKELHKVSVTLCSKSERGGGMREMVGKE